MIIPIIKKARENYNTSLVWLDYVDDKVIWFDVKGHKVRFQYGKGFLNMSCDCKFEGIKGIPNGSLCSHILTALFYCYFKKGNIKKK